MAFVIIQHLDPSHPSVFPPFLAKKCSLPVRKAPKGTNVETNPATSFPELMMPLEEFLPKRLVVEDDRLTLPGSEAPTLMLSDRRLNGDLDGDGILLTMEDVSGARGLAENEMSWSVT